MKHKFKVSKELRDGNWIVTIRCPKCGLKGETQMRSSLLASTIGNRIVQFKRGFKSRNEDCPTTIARIVHDT